MNDKETGILDIEVLYSGANILENFAPGKKVYPTFFASEDGNSTITVQVTGGDNVSINGNPGHTATIDFYEDRLIEVVADSVNPGEPASYFIILDDEPVPASMVIEGEEKIELAENDETVRWRARVYDQYGNEMEEDVEWNTEEIPAEYDYIIWGFHNDRLTINIPEDSASYAINMEAWVKNYSRVSEEKTLFVNYKPPAQLSDLTENLKADFAPAFSPDRYEYTLEADYTEDQVELTATLEDATISYSYEDREVGMVENKVVDSGTAETVNLLTGENVITIEVEKAGYSKTIYTITITRAAQPETEEVEYEAAGEITEIDPDTVTYADNSFTVPLGVTEFTFKDDGQEKRASRDAGTGAWTIVSLFVVSFSVTGENGTLEATVDGAPVSSGEKVSAGKDAVFTATPAEGYLVEAWTVNGEAVEENPGEQLTVENIQTDIVVTVEFASTPAVTYKLVVEIEGEGTTDPAAGSYEFEQGEEVTLTAAPAGDWQFEKWVINGTAYTETTLVIIMDEDKTAVAYFKDPAATYHTVTFESNGGSAVASQSVEHGSTAVQPADPTRVSYSFTGWYGDEELTEAYDFSTPVTADITLYAGWTEKTTYTVTYDGNGNTCGAVPEDGTRYEEGDTVTVSGNTGNLERDGHTFAGWNTEADGSGIGYSGGDTFIMGSTDVTLYARWIANIYTVTFESNGGSAVASQSVEHGSTAVQPADPTRVSYSFTGWYGDEELTEAYDFSTPVTADITLYARWKKKETKPSAGDLHTEHPDDPGRPAYPDDTGYTVTYDGNGHTGGTVPVDHTRYKEGDSVAVPNNTGGLAKTGYHFFGWNTAKDGSGTSYSAGDTFEIGNSDVILYARWVRMILKDDRNGITLEGIFDGSVTVRVNRIDDGDEIYHLAVSAVQGDLEDKKVVALYKIKLFKNNEEIHPGGKITITINIPEELRHLQGLEVAHIHPNGTVTLLNAERVEDTLVFETSYLGYYCLTADHQVEGSKFIFNVLYVILILIGLAFLIIFAGRYKKGRRLVLELF